MVRIAGAPGSAPSRAAMGQVQSDIKGISAGSRVSRHAQTQKTAEFPGS
jgi:hypothetical protein